MSDFYMGLDLSQRAAGCAVIEDDGSIPFSLSARDVRPCFHDVWGYSLKKDATPKEKTERQVYIAKKIIQAAKLHMVGSGTLHIAIENYAFSTVKNAKGRSFQSSSQTGLAELQGVVKSQLLLALSIFPTVYSVKTARMVVFGNGNFEKSKIKPTLTEWGMEFKDDNDADAYVIAECHRQKMKGWTDERRRKK